VAKLDMGLAGHHMAGNKVACEGTGSKVGTSERGTYLEGTEVGHSALD